MYLQKLLVNFFFQLLRDIQNLGEKNKEQPLCRAYSIKARALIHAHLSRLVLNPQTLDKDRQLIVKKSPYLVLEMVNCVNQLIALAYAGRGMTSLLHTCNGRALWRI